MTDTPPPSCPYCGKPRAKRKRDIYVKGRYAETTLIDGVWHFGTLTPRQSEEMHRDDEPDLYRLGKKRAGRLLDGIEWNQMPEIHR